METTNKAMVGRLQLKMSQLVRHLTLLLTSLVILGYISEMIGVVRQKTPS